MVTIITLTNIIGLFTWSFPLAVLTYLAYYIESRTKFKTRWRWFLAAALIAVIHPLVLARDYAVYGNSLISHLLVINSMLCVSLIMAAYASLSLLRFQNISLGKTKKTVELLIIIGFFVPTVACAAGGIRLAVAVDLFLYNTSVASMVLLYLTIGKIARKYLSAFGGFAYALARVGSIILLVDWAARNYAYVAALSLADRYVYRLIGNLSQFSANILLAVSAVMLINEARIRGLHIMPSSEDLRRVRAGYRLKKGHGYIIDGDDKALDVFVDYISNKYHGLCITRTNPQDIREKHELRTTPIVWLTNAETDEKSMKPRDLARILKVVEDFTESSGKSMVLVQRLDYLITQNDFKSVLNFIQSLNDGITSSASILLVSVDPSTLSPGEWSLLTQELTVVGDVGTAAMPVKLYEVLEFVHSENKMNRMPSFREVGETVGMTKTTIRRRVRELERRGLITVECEGKYKLLKLSERGRNTVLASVLKTKDA